VSITAYWDMTACTEVTKCAKEQAAFLFSAEERTDLGNTVCDAGKEEMGSEA